MSIKQLNKGEADLDEVQNAELTLRRVHTEDKVEGRVVPVNQLVVGASDETVRRKTKCCFTGNIIVPAGNKLGKTIKCMLYNAKLGLGL